MVNTLLILCSRLDLDHHSQSQITKILDSKPDWDQIIKRARQEGVGPLLFHHLKKFKSKIPSESFEHLKSLYVKSAAHGISLLRNIEPFFLNVQGLEIRMALIKGARLAVTLYSDPALRPFVDIDLIISSQHKRKADEILESIGFLHPSEEKQASHSGLEESFWMYRPYFIKDRCLIELHVNFPGLPDILDSSDPIWEKCGRTAIGKAEAPVLSQEDELCLLCMHVQQHSYSRLIWLTDIVEAASRWAIDWKRVLHICDREKIHASVYYALLTVNTIWPNSISPHILCRFRLSWIEKQLLKFLWPQKGLRSRTLSLDFPMHTPTVFALFARRKVISALKTLLRIYFPPRAWIKHYYGISENSFGMIRHYLWRLYRPVFVVSRRILRLY